MSQYLIIRKDGTTIGEWSCSTQIYHAFYRAPYGEEKQFDPEKEFRFSINHLKIQIEGYKNSKDIYERILPGLKSYEERFDTITSIKKLEDEIAECEVAMHDIYFMQNCYECGTYNDKEENIWTWSVG